MVRTFKLSGAAVGRQVAVPAILWAIGVGVWVAYFWPAFHRPPTDLGLDELKDCILWAVPLVWLFALVAYRSTQALRGGMAIVVGDDWIRVPEFGKLTYPDISEMKFEDLITVAFVKAPFRGRRRIEIDKTRYAQAEELEASLREFSQPLLARSP